MRRPQSPIVLRARGLLVLLALACAAGGCVTNGDFGRVRPEMTADNMHDWVGRDAVGRSAARHPNSGPPTTSGNCATAPMR